MKALFIVCFSACFVFSAFAELTAVGIYTDDALATNGVIRDARFFNGIGPGNDPDLILGVHQFAAMVKPSFDAGFGGVVDFESGTIDTPRSFKVSFDDGAKTIGFTQSTVSAYIIKSYLHDDRTPTSGTNALTKDIGSPDFQFRLVSFRGRAPQEAIVAFGVTVLGRNNSRPHSSWTGRAYLEDGKGETAITRSRVIDLNTGSGNAVDDAFFGFRAPEGWFINKVVINSDSHVFTSVDDLAFVTAVVEPPPAPIATAGPMSAVELPVTLRPVVAVSPVAVASPTPPVKAGARASQLQWWIAGALGVIIVLLTVLIGILKRGGHPASRAPVVLAVPSPFSIPDDVPPNQPASPPPIQIPTELTEFAKQALVQSLYSQRQALLETQKLAKQQLAELESRFNKLHLPSQDRIRAYEERIASLERALSEKDDSLRELTNATLLLIRRRLDEEKEKEKQQNWFS